MQTGEEAQQKARGGEQCVVKNLSSSTIPLSEIEITGAANKIKNVHGIISSVDDGAAMRLFKCGKYLDQEKTKIDLVLESMMISKKFTICKLVPGIIAAGGCVCNTLNRYFIDETSSTLPAKKHAERPAVTQATDVDLYPRANTREEAMEIVQKVIEVLKPVGDVTMSKFAVSLNVSEEMFKFNVYDGNDISACENKSYFGEHTGVIYKVQIIANPIPKTDNICRDLETLFSRYDLSCCQVATDGTDIYATRAAIKTLSETRVCDVRWDVITSVKRLVKYYRRSFDFALIMPDGSRITSLPNPNSKGAKRIKALLKKKPVPQRLSKAVAAAPKLDDDGDAEDPKDRSSAPDSCYVRYISIRDMKQKWLLDTLFEYFRQDEKRPLPELACCGSEKVSDIITMMNTGKIPSGMVDEWAYDRMNKYIEENFSSATRPQKEIDTLTELFSKDIDAFKDYISKTHKVDQFINDTLIQYARNTDPAEFCKYWLEDDDGDTSPVAEGGAIAPVPSQQVSKKRNRPDDKEEEQPSAKRLCTTGGEGEKPILAAAAATVSTAVALQQQQPATPYRFSEYDISEISLMECDNDLYKSTRDRIGYIMFPTVVANGINKKFEMQLKNVLSVSGIHNFYSAIQNDSKLSMLISLGSAKVKDERLAAMRSFVGALEEKCVELVKQSGLFDKNFIYMPERKLNLVSRMREIDSNYSISLHLHADDHDTLSKSMVCRRDAVAPDDLVSLNINNCERETKNHYMDITAVVEWIFIKANKHRYEDVASTFDVSVHISATQVIVGDANTQQASE